MQIIAQAPNLPGAGQGASSTAEFYFDDSKAVDAIVTIPVNAVLRATSGAAGVAGSDDAILASPKKFWVRAGGRINAQAGTTPDFNVFLDAGDDATNTNNTTIGTTGSIVLDNDTTIQSWAIEAELQLSPTNSKLQGSFTGWVNNTIVAQTALTESVEDLVASGKLNFKVAGQFSESIAAQTAVCDYLQVLQ